MAVEPRGHGARGQEFHLHAGPGPAAAVSGHEGRGGGSAVYAAFQLDAAVLVDHADVVA